MKNALAVAATLALALAGCSGSGSTTTQTSPNTGSVGSVDMHLTLPDGTVINTVNYSVTGGSLSTARNGTVNVENSTQLRFRVGNLPVANGYTMTLGATTASGSACAGSAGFNVENNQVTTLTMQLVCGSGVVVEVDTNGDVSVTVEVVNEAGVTCPVVTGISALPLEVLVGFSLSLEGFVTSTTGVTYAWSGTGGTFAAPAAAATGFLCQTAGEHPLSFAISKTGCAASTMPVTVTCTANADASVPDAGTPDTSVPDTSVPDTSVPDTSVPDTSVPDTSVPDTSVPDAGPSWPLGSTACVECQQTNCTAYGLDGDNVLDPCNDSLCRQLVACTLDTDCFSSTANIPQCFCGGTIDPATGAYTYVSTDECLAASYTTLNGPCLTLTQQGLMTTDKGQIFERTVNPAFPGGRGYQLVTCIADVCQSACL